MRKFIAGLLIILFSFNFQVLAGPGDHFPWGSELPFPWKDIQGTWVTQINGVDAYVTFKAVRTDACYRQLKITILDPATCKVLAVGGGYEEDRVVKGILTGDNRASKVTVHVFREADMGPDFKHKSVISDVTVTIMSFTPISSSSSEKVAYELSKVSDDPRIICQ